MEEVIARGIQVLIALSVTYLVALWFVLIVWTYRDSEARSRSVITQVFSTLLVVLFYLPGLVLYLILRPKETLDVAFQRSLEEEYLLQDLEELPHCPSCHRFVEDDYRLCPHCQTQLRESCVACGRLVDLKWSLCPYCGEVQGGRETRPSIKVVEPAERYIAPPEGERPASVPGPPRIEPLPYPDMTPALDEPAMTEPAGIRAVSGDGQETTIRPFDRRYTRAAASLRAQGAGSPPSEAERAQLELVEVEETTTAASETPKNGRFSRTPMPSAGTNGTTPQAIESSAQDDEDASELEPSAKTASSD